MKSVPLPTPILDSIENPFADIRLGAVQQLTKLLHGKNHGLARSAREALETIAENDDSRQVSRAAAQALESTRQGGQPTVRLEDEAAQPPPVQKEEQLKPVADEITHVSNRQAFMTLGWAIAGVFGGFFYDTFTGFIGGTIGGAIGGLFTATALRNENTRSNGINVLWITLAWAIGGGIGWTIGWGLTEAIGAGIGIGIFAAIGLASTLGVEHIRSNWKGVVGIILAWAIGGGIGWYISRRVMIDNLDLEYAISWSVGTAIGWGIGGFVMGWQLLKNMNKKDA